MDDINDLPADELARWVEKTAYAPGVPDDPKLIPTLRYLKQGDRVYTLQKWRDGATVRGEVKVDALNDLRQEEGEATEDGWYNALGIFLGDDPGWPRFEEPDFPAE